MKEKIRLYIRKVIAENIDEKAVSKSQQRFMGMVKNCQDNPEDCDKYSKSVKDAAKSMTKKDAEDFASTKHKGLPNHVNEEMKEAGDWFPIGTPLGSPDFKLFAGIVNQGIDSHLEGFTKSEFNRKGDRFLFNFHTSEIPILLRRLRELGTEEGDMWADDIENYESDAE